MKARAVLAAIVVLAIPSQVAAQEAPAPPIAVDAHLVDTLAQGGASLADVDMYAGELREARELSGEDTVLAMQHAQVLEVDTAAIAQEARRNALASAQRAASAGCPTSAPAGTLRGGSDRIGVLRLCQESVARAATPQAAFAIKFMLANLGVPYSQELRMREGFFDCSSYVMRAYAAAGLGVIQRGWAPTTHAIAPHSGWSSMPWLTTVRGEEIRPGDMLLWTPPERVGHVAVQLWGGFMVHTARTGDVSNVESDRYLGPPRVVRRLLPDRV